MGYIGDLSVFKLHQFDMLVIIKGKIMGESKLPISDAWLKKTFISLPYNGTTHQALDRGCLIAEGQHAKHGEVFAHFLVCW